jgi:hypothetical protein
VKLAIELAVKEIAGFTVIILSGDTLAICRKDSCAGGILIL